MSDSKRTPPAFIRSPEPIIYLGSDSRVPAVSIEHVTVAEFIEEREEDYRDYEEAEQRFDAAHADAVELLETGSLTIADPTNFIAVYVVKDRAQFQQELETINVERRGF